MVKILFELGVRTVFAGFAQVSWVCSPVVLSTIVPFRLGSVGNLGEKRISWGWFCFVAYSHKKFCGGPATCNERWIRQSMKRSSLCKSGGGNKRAEISDIGGEAYDFRTVHRTR